LLQFNVFAIIFLKLDHALSITMHLLRDASLFFKSGRVNSDF